MEQKFCQSCAMPMENQAQGTNADKTQNEDYCSYCYQDGSFTKESSMEEMIGFCAPLMAQGNAGMTEEDAKAQMQKFFPQLKRWKKT